MHPGRKEKPPPWKPRPAGDQSTPEKARAAREAAGARTPHAGRRCRFSSRRPKHSSDRFRQVGGSKWKYSQQPRKVTPAPGVGGWGGRKVKRGTSPKAGCRGTRGARPARPDAPGRGCRRLGRDSGSGHRDPSPREPAQLSPPRVPWRVPGRPGEEWGDERSHSPAALCAPAPGSGGSCRRRSRLRASAARLAIRAAAGDSAPFRGGRGRGRDWDGRGAARHRRRGRGLCAPGAPGWLLWAPGAGAAALEAEARRELRREAGRGRDVLGGGRCPPSPNAAANVARPGAPPRPRTHPRAHARAWHTPAAGTLGLPCSPSARLAGSGPLAESRAYTRPHPRTDSCTPMPRRVLASSPRAAPRSQASSAQLGRRYRGRWRERGSFRLNSEWENR